MLLLGVSETEAAFPEGGPELGGLIGDIVIFFSSVALEFDPVGDTSLVNDSVSCWATGCFGELCIIAGLTLPFTTMYALGLPSALRFVVAAATDWCSA